MKPGRLRHRGLVEQPAPPVLDSDGAHVESPEWLAVFDHLVAMDIQPMSGREYLAASAVQSKVNTRIVVRFHASFAARMRITHRETVYNIEAVLPDKDSGVHYLTLLCSSGVNNG